MVRVLEQFLLLIILYTLNYELSTHKIDNRINFTMGVGLWMDKFLMKISNVLCGKITLRKNNFPYIREYLRLPLRLGSASNLLRRALTL